MSCDSTNTLLITADIEGFVSLWDIRNYCIDRTSSSTPKCKQHGVRLNKNFHLYTFTGTEIVKMLIYCICITT